MTTEFCYVIKHLKENKYLAYSHHRPLWTSSLVFAKTFISGGDAVECAQAQGGAPQLILMRRADLDDVAQAEAEEEARLEEEGDFYAEGSKHGYITG